MTVHRYWLATSGRIGVKRQQAPQTLQWLGRVVFFLDCGGMAALLILGAVAVTLVSSPVIGHAAGSAIFTTPHNLSVSGPGSIKALSETRVCVFCHTPHNGSPQTPLWNKTITPVNYVLYSSSTLKAAMAQPSGPTRLCLSCHDGTIALGNVLSEATDIGMTKQKITADLASYIGTNLNNDHPVSFPYPDALPNPELSAQYPTQLLQYDQSYVHCTTCHDPHDNQYGKFLVQDNSYSALCVLCHQMSGWSLAAHRTSTATWDNTGNNPWPHTSWLTVAENGCENCHTPHNAGGGARLLQYQQEEDNCLGCHNGSVAAKDLAADFAKISVHPMDMATIGLSPNAHDPAESPTAVTGHVECVDCHNPHAAFAASTRQPPQVPGDLVQVSGVSQAGTPLDVAAYEYEICFKCHGDLASGPTSYIKRWIDQTNTLLEFNQLNPSFHPVTAVGKNIDVPSIPSSYEPSMTVGSRLYCSSCHDSDTSPAVGGIGARGPHGSQYAPLLRENYSLVDGTTESFAAYALCYRCHDRTSILNNESFQTNLAGKGGHNGHLTGHGQALPGATCAVCHDPHGVNDDGMSGSHTHLINFDATLVTPATGQTVPFFTDKGSRSGSCTLICHGFEHTDANSSYP